jgi:hypothetical protein
LFIFLWRTIVTMKYIFIGIINLISSRHRTESFHLLFDLKLFLLLLHTYYILKVFHRTYDIHIFAKILRIMFIHIVYTYIIWCWIPHHLQCTDAIYFLLLNIIHLQLQIHLYVIFFQLLNLLQGLYDRWIIIFGFFILLI